MQFCWQITIMLKKIMKKETQKSLFVKGVIVVLTACLMMIPILMVRLVVEDREDLSEKVRKEIADSWGYRQVLHAPALKVPYKDKRTYPDGGIYYEDSFCTNYSEVVTVESDVSVELLHRSIYDIPVYRADIKFSGTVIPDAELVEKARRYGGCWLYLDLSGLKGIEGDLDVEINGSRQGFTPSGTSLRTRIPAESLQESVPVDYSFSVRLKGSQSLNFSPDAGTTRSLSWFPRRGCSSAMQMQSATEGCERAAFSTSTGETLSPPTFIVSSLLPVRCSLPRPSILPQSFVYRIPSFIILSVAARSAA